jgi:branched-chain amino acid transport system permease protein
MISLMTLGRSLPLGSLILVVGGAALGTIGGAYHLLSVRLRKAITAALIWVVLFGLLQSIVIQILRGSRSLGIDLLIGVFGDPPASPVLIRVLYQPDGALRVLSAVVIGLVVFGVAYWLGGRAKRPRFADRFARMERGKRTRTILILAVVFLVLGALGPPILGRFMSQVLDVAGIYLVMALGLNIVVGYAGLLDLGYVAFFAVGAYTTAILTSPTSPAFSPELNWWLAIPFVMMAAALAGLIVGTPVLRMRGDYLAIVTLGFGEIVRILFLSDWLKPVFGGAQGIRQIPAIPPQSLDLNNPQWFLYIVIIFAVVAAYVSWALQDSRIGRAWMAMREDESVAEVMGVDTVVAKLSAFIIGAIFASLGGALFAAKVHSVFPNLFEIIVSIQILIIVIVGGMGSIRGVMVGALLIIALPELLREFEFYRFLLYGALLIYMMLARPEGLIPSRRRAAELHEDERSQDVWLKKEEAPQPGRGEA